MAPNTPTRRAKVPTTKYSQSSPTGKSFQLATKGAPSEGNCLLTKGRYSPRMPAVTLAAVKKASPPYEMGSSKRWPLKMPTARAHCTVTTPTINSTHHRSAFRRGVSGGRRKRMTAFTAGFSMSVGFVACRGALLPGRRGRGGAPRLPRTPRASTRRGRRGCGRRFEWGCLL